MKRKRHTPEQIIAKLREAEAVLSAGGTIAQVVQQIGVSEQSLLVVGGGDGGVVGLGGDW